ncbi:gamma-2-syntrophin [Triplophysa rosa]|uniref:Gamma-2-syntrophin n=1 Tax=Triplophysa rosa TaxID=992332 RepID=A0A9W7TWK0_TRIRA|nr:gamma-2-syntrophin [Triplophysa rosa]
MNAAKHPPDLLERPASLLVPTWNTTEDILKNVDNQTTLNSIDSIDSVSLRKQSHTQTKTGLALLFDEHTSNAYDVRLKLTKELLIIQKQDVVCVSGAESHLNHRTVVLRRQLTGGLGLSIKGGAEHKVPVVISKIFKDQVANQTGMLFIGDAVLQVNGINVEKCTHEEVVHLLRTAGDEVTITVRYLREAPAFLKLPLGSPGPSSDQSSRASSPLFDSGLHLNGNSSNTSWKQTKQAANSRYRRVNNIHSFMFFK